MSAGFVHAAFADWREDIGVFRIGIVVSGDVQGTLSRLEPFRLAIVDALEMDVAFFHTTSSKLLIDALVRERIEYALLSASGYAVAAVRCECVEPLVIPRSLDSTDGYHLVGIVKRNDELNLERLSTKRIGMVSPEGVLGEEFVRYLLAREVDISGNSRIFFSSKNTSEATQRAFADGEYDVLFGWSSLTGDPAEGYSRGSLRQIVENLRRPARNYRIDWKSSAIPHRPHVLRKKLPGEVKTRLRDALVNLYERNPVAYDAVEPVYGGGFTAARNERFSDLIQFLGTFYSVVPEEDTQSTGSIELNE
ncbi:MAG: PhnD/SsuA/transferrin family substrate-binding protein [Pseudomonadota bacterium]